MLVHSAPLGLDGQTRSVEHQFDMASLSTSHPRLVHRTARIGLRLTRAQRNRCYGLLRSAGDVWACVLEVNHWRWRLCRAAGGVVSGVVLGSCPRQVRARSVSWTRFTGARSVLRRFSDAWFAAAKRRKRRPRPASRGAGALLCRCAGITARSPSTAAGSGSRPPGCPRCGCAWTGRCRTRPSRSARSPCCMRAAACSSRSPPRFRSA